jgi:hypothetical protein
LWSIFHQVDLGHVSEKCVYDMIGNPGRVYRMTMVLSLGCSLAFGQGIAGQVGVVQTDENIRASENGILLGRMIRGLELNPLALRDNWLEFNLGGWVWEQSLQSVDRGDFDLVVSIAQGENIRDNPQGEIIGRLENGTLLRFIERVDGWIRVERAVWIWARSVDVKNSNIEPNNEDLKAGEDGMEWLTVRGRDLPILDAPNGDTLFRARPRSALTVLAREGNWAKVTIDGWIWAPATSEELLDLPVIVDIEIRDLVQRREELQGRVLRWDLQFISIEDADEIRSDFFENEKFLVTKLVDSENDFIYVTVPLNLTKVVTFLSPLEHIRVVGRLRTASEKLTEAPVLELISFEKIPS